MHPKFTGFTVIYTILPTFLAKGAWLEKTGLILYGLIPGDERKIPPHSNT